LPGPGFRADSGALGSLQISLSSHIDLINAAIGTATFGTIPSSNSAYGANNGGGYYGNLFGNSAKAGFGGMDFYQYANNMDTFALIETKLAGPMVLSSTGNLAVSAVPLPAAVWLFGSGLLGLVGIGRRRKQA
jgi:hypothetical protein